MPRPKQHGSSPATARGCWVCGRARGRKVLVRAFLPHTMSCISSCCRRLVTAPAAGREEGPLGGLGDPAAEADALTVAVVAMLNVRGVLDARLDKGEKSEWGLGGFQSQEPTSRAVLKEGAGGTCSAARHNFKMAGGAPSLPHPLWLCAAVGDRCGHLQSERKET